jgi:hypothetical protein
MERELEKFRTEDEREEARKRHVRQADDLHDVVERLRKEEQKHWWFAQLIARAPLEAAAEIIPQDLTSFEDNVSTIAQTPTTEVA